MTDREPSRLDPFCKIFETPDLGQILVLFCEGDDGAEVRFHFRLKDLGVCMVALGFGEDFDGAEHLLLNVDEARAREVVDALELSLSGATREDWPADEE